MRGFAFNNITISSEDDVFYIKSSIPETPPISYFEFDAPKRNGSSYYFNKYKDKEIVITVGIKAPTFNELNAKKRALLQSIIGIKGKLVLLHEPELYYKAEILNEINSVRYGNYIELAIPFICSYCKYSINDKNIILSTGVNSINNAGNFTAETLFKITATVAGDIIVTGDTNAFKIANMTTGETVYVDSKNMVAYKISGDIKTSVLQRFTGKFISLPPGNGNITISGTGTAEVIISYNDTYIV